VRTQAGGGAAAAACGGSRLGQDVGKGCAGEHFLDTGGRVVQSPMEGTEVVAVRRQSERARLDAS